MKNWNSGETLCVPFSIVRSRFFPSPFAFAGLICLWVLATGTAAAASSDVRFSNTLNADERTASGLTKLSSDEVAVIDALVRRDTARAGAANPSAPTFSGRLTAGERETAGLKKLTDEELPQLDSFIARYQGAKLARALLAPPTYLARHSRGAPTEAKQERQIHGSFSLSYGFGSGGYSEKTGSMMLTLDDPARRYSISIGYSESHVKGGHLYHDPYYTRGPLLSRDPFDDLRDPFYDSRSPLSRPVRVIPEGGLFDRP